MFRDPIRKLLDRPDSLRDNLIAYVISGAVVTPVGVATFQISKLLHRNLSELSSGAIGFGLGGIVLLIWAYRQKIGEILAITKTATGERVAIYVAQFKNENADQKLLRDRIEATLRADYGDAIEIQRAFLPPFPEISENAESEIAQVFAVAQAELTRADGDILIWGTLHRIGNDSCTVHFVPVEGKEPPEKSFNFRPGAAALLEEEFSAELGAVLTTRAFADQKSAEQVVMSGQSIDAIRPFALRLDHLIEHLPKSVRPRDRGLLFRACGIVYDAIGFQSGENTALDIAIQRLDACLQILTQDLFPSDWARTKYAIGDTLRVQGQREYGDQKLHLAEEALRAALGVPEFLQDIQAQRCLGRVLVELAMRKKEPEAIHQALILFDHVLGSITPESDLNLWTTIKIDIGMALRILAQFEKGTAYCEQSLAAFESALAKLADKELPNAARANVEMAATLRIWGARTEDPEKLRRAIEVIRSALTGFKHNPLNWATAQVTLGDTCCSLSNLEGGDSHLKEAIEAYELALTELSPSRDADLWSATQYECGLTLEALGEIHPYDTVLFERAKTAFSQAWTVWDDPDSADYDKVLRAYAHVDKRLKDRLRGLP